MVVIKKFENVIPVDFGEFELKFVTSDENILTLNQVDYSLRGTTKYNATKKYVVTQIRRN